MNKIILFLFLIFGFGFSNTGQAQVLINEFSAANQDLIFDNYGEDGDWLELYNAGTTTIDLAGYHLSDKIDNVTKFIIPASVTIAPGEYIVVWLSGRDEYLGGVLHTNFKITQTKANESIVLSSPLGTVVDFHPLDVPNKFGHSWARMTDGGSNWGVSTIPTPGATNSNVSEPYVSKPEISPAAGFYSGNIPVTITVDDPNATIYYTTDGSEPNTSSTPYTGPINVSFTTPIKAIAINTGNSNALASFVDFHTFFIDELHTIPVVSITGNSIMTLMNGSWNAEPIGTFELFDQSGVRVSDASGEFNKHGNDSWAYPQRGIDYITRDEFGDDYAVKHPIFDPQITDRDEFQRIILKAAANDNYPFEDGGAHIRDAYIHTLSQLANLEMDERTSESCILYINGQYWGVYEMREKVDDNDYTKYYYDQGREWIDFLKTWGNTWAEYGSIADWNTLRDFILSNDMSIAANYAIVEDQFEVLSLIDYVVLHSHTVSSDWLNWNTAWWRGRKPTGGALKWRYVLWDEDATFGHYINYTGIPDVTANADPCNPEILGDPGGQGHIPIFNALLNNDDFLSLYINRYADLNNTYFTCDYMIDLLDEMITRIEPEMQRHTARWGGSVNGWQNNVQILRDYILLRCTVISDGIVDCYEDEGITGPFNITINVEPPGSGDVHVNTITGLNYPWNAEYFGGVDFDLTAIPNCSYSFDYWTVDNHSFGPDQFSEAIYMSLVSDDVITAHFINDNTPLVLDAISPLCPDDQPVSLSASPVGGLWTGIPNGLFDPQAFGSGTHTVTYVYTYSNGCEDSLSMDIVVNDNPIVDISGPITFCAGSSATLDAGDGFGDYIWNTGSTEQIIEVSTAGTYSVTVTDNDGCTATDDFTTNNIDGIIINANFNAPDCQGDCNGFIDISAQGGNPPYDYLWSNGETVEDLSDLCFGIYTVIVTDADGCTATQEYDLEEPSGLTIDASISNVVCFSSCNGQIDLQVTGGLEPYTYQWDCGDPTANEQQNLCGGLCNVTVTDANGCEAIASYTIEEPEELTAVLSPESVSCEGECDGFVGLTINGGTGPYSFLWSNNTTVCDLSQACSGPYSVIVTDANGCTVEGQVVIDEPSALTINAVVAPPICGTNCDGIITLDVSGGTLPFTFQWSDNSADEDRTGLCNGDYQLTVSDANGCSQTAFYTITENQNPSPTISGATSFCSGDFTTLDAGTGYETYLWSTGATSQTIDISNSTVISVTVTDNNGCTGEDNLTTVENNILAPTITGATEFCDGESTTLDVGSGYVSYLWSTGENTPTITVSISGTYSVVVSDGNGCTVLSEVEVTNFSNPDPVIAGSSTFCNGGSTILDAGNYESYLWSTGETTATILVTSPGVYDVEVVDQNGCFGTASLEVTESSSITPYIAGDLEFCLGGSTILDAGNYASYLWSTGETTATILVTNPGIYGVEVVDQDGCFGTASVEITESSSITPSITGDLEFCSGASTILDAGLGFDAYLWSDGSANQTFEVTLSGEYGVTVTDGQGCTGETTISIIETTPPMATFSDNISTCNTDVGGSILNLYDLILSGDTNGTWEDVDNSGAIGLFNNLDFNNVSAGDYNFIYTTNSAIAPCEEISYPVIITVIDCSCPDVQFLITDPLCNADGVLDLTTIENTTEAGTWTIFQSPAGTNPATVNNGLFEAFGADAGEYILQFELTNPPSPGCPLEYFTTIAVDSAPEAGTVISSPQFCILDDEIVDLADLIFGEVSDGIWVETSVIPSTSGAFDPLSGTFATGLQDPGIYTFQYTVLSNGACPDDFTEVSVTINSRPVTVILEEDVNLDCYSSTVVLDASFSDSGSDFDIAWDGPGVVFDGNENTLTPTVDAVGNYTLTITNLITGCTSVTGASVSDNTVAPQLSVPTDQHLDCNTTSATLQLSGDIIPPFQIQWSGPDIDATNENSPAPEINIPGTYLVNLFNPDNGCFTVDSVIVSQNIIPPTLVIQSALEELDCNNPTAGLIADSPSSNISYEWFDDQNNSIGNTPIIDDISQVGIYTVIITDINNGCTSSDFIEVIDNTNYPLAEAGNPTLINCIEQEITLDGSASQSGADITYIWSGPGISGPVDQATSNANLPGTYILTVTNISNGCSSSDQVVIGEDTQAPEIILNQPESLDCIVETVLLDGTGSSFGPDFIYTWLDENGNTISDNLLVEVQNSGIYTLNILNSANGCENSSNLLVSENTDFPTEAMVETTELDCGDVEGSLAVLEVIGGTPPYVYALNGSDFSTTPVFENLTLGNYNLLIQDANGCNLENIVTITAPVEPNIDLGPDLDLRFGDSIIIEALVDIPISQIDTIIWSPANIINCNDPDCLEVGVSSFNSLEVSALVIGINGCVDSDELRVNMRKSRDVYIPNTFSPNDDGYNDFFTIFTNEQQVINIPSFKIFNRWGELMFNATNFQANDPNNGWDGSFAGERMNTGVFIYMVEIEFIDGRVQMYKGDVTLIR